MQLMQEAQDAGENAGASAHRRTQASMVRCGSRWMHWTSWDIPYESCPGVSACFGAAASLNLEYTLPGVSQTLIITRMEGRTGVPQKESIESLAAHQASMAIYLSTGMLRELSRRLIGGRLCGEHPRSPDLQGNLAGGRGLYLYGGDTGTGSGRTRHH